MIKHSIKSLYQLDFFISNEIMCQILDTKTTFLFEKLATWVIKEWFFIFYNNMTFTKKFKIKKYIIKLIKSIILIDISIS